MADESRIQQFKQMAEADPENELGHFSLGKAYLDADRPADAVGPLSRALELNGRLSKAYQLLGLAREQAGQREEAIEILTRGVTAADEQGDRMPRDAMVEMLKQWGATVPELKSGEATDEAPSGESADSPGFRCSRCGRPTGKLEKPPFKGVMGAKIFDHACSTCWREWIPMGTKVINELGLTLSSPAGSKAYDEYMLEFLQIDQQ